MESEEGGQARRDVVDRATIVDVNNLDVDGNYNVERKAEWEGIEQGAEEEQDVGEEQEHAELDWECGVQGNEQSELKANDEETDYENGSKNEWNAMYWHEK